MKYYEEFKKWHKDLSVIQKIMFDSLTYPVIVWAIFSFVACIVTSVAIGELQLGIWWSIFYYFGYDYAALRVFVFIVHLIAVVSIYFVSVNHYKQQERKQRKYQRKYRLGEF